MYQRKIPKEYYCTVDYALDIFGGKWKPRLLCILANEGPIRYGQLKDEMEDISDAALADSLKELQNQEIVQRHQYNEMPIRVEYSLTERGQSLIPVLDTISQWAVNHSQANIYTGKHFAKVHKAQFKSKHSSNL